MKSYKIDLGFFKGLFKSMKFNVTLIQPNDYTHSFALLEAAEYVNIRINQCGYESTLTKNHLEHNAINVVLCGHLIAEELLNADHKLIIFNSEQLPEDSVWTSPHYKNLLDKNFVWDYSPANLLKIRHGNTRLIDFFYCNPLSRITINKPAKYDLLFYGSMNDRRKKILDNLNKSGLRVKVVFGVYGLERDALISESRAVLNLHYYDSQIFQQVRAFYPLINRIPVISESYPLESAPAIYKEALFLNKDESIEDYTLRILSSDHFEAEAEARLDKFKGTDLQNQLSDIIKSSLGSINKN
jgi:hypothetical protein